MSPSPNYVAQYLAVSGRVFMQWKQRGRSPLRVLYPPFDLATWLRAALFAEHGDGLAACALPDFTPELPTFEAVRTSCRMHAERLLPGGQWDRIVLPRSECLLYVVDAQACGDPVAQTWYIWRGRRVPSLILVRAHAFPLRAGADVVHALRSSPYRLHLN